MKQSVLRRNRRKRTAGSFPISHIALCGISIIIFLGGACSLSWALHDAHDKSESPESLPTQAKDARINPYDGLIVSGAAPETEDEGVDDFVEVDEAESETPESPDEDNDTQSEPPIESPRNASEPISAQPSSPASSPAPQAQQGFVVHHTAVREEKVYATVHHQASRPREVTIGGITHIEWTSCPVCGKRHDSAYNERRVDHVNRIGCAVCGAYHDAAYDEKVYG